jgi:hypothetical protein
MRCRPGCARDIFESVTKCVAIAIAAMALSACKPGTSGSRPHRPGHRDRGHAAPDEPTTPVAKPEPAPPCGGIGVPWDGKPQGCTYEYEGCCYADAETACKMASCAPEHCTVLETYPAQIACDTLDAG